MMLMNDGAIFVSYSMWRPSSENILFPIICVLTEIIIGIVTNVREITVLFDLFGYTIQKNQGNLENPIPYLAQSNAQMLTPDLSYNGITDLFT
jgi:hypothetical protein